MKTQTVSRRRVYMYVARCWAHVILSIVATTIIVVSLSLLIGRFDMQLTIGILGGVACLAIGCVIISPLIVRHYGRLEPVDPKQHGELLSVFGEVLQARPVMIRPRLFVTHISCPNAFAFGWGPFRGIAVSPKLYELLERDELKAVLAHEYAHLISRDTALMTVTAILKGQRNQHRRLCRSQTKPLGGRVIARLLNIGIEVLCVPLSPLLREGLKHQREFSADALSALQCGGTEPLIRALNKLQAYSSPRERGGGILSDLYFSHAGLSRRVGRLRGLVSGTTSPSINLAR